jgi:hypothetical protein
VAEDSFVLDPGRATQRACNRSRTQIGFLTGDDLSNLMVMLDLKLGGGVMAAVNEGQKLTVPHP